MAASVVENHRYTNQKVVTPGASIRCSWQVYMKDADGWINAPEMRFHGLADFAQHAKTMVAIHCRRTEETFARWACQQRVGWRATGFRVLHVGLLEKCGKRVRR